MISEGEPCCIRDLEPTAPDKLLAIRRPEADFRPPGLHARALLEAHPDEAVLNNVVGTRQLVETARAHGAGMLVRCGSCCAPPRWPRAGRSPERSAARRSRRRCIALLGSLVR